MKEEQGRVEKEVFERPRTCSGRMGKRVGRPWPEAITTTLHYCFTLFGAS